MFNEKNQDRNDSLGQRLQRIGGQMNPSPALKKAAKTGVPLRPMAKSYTAGTHIRKFAKAVLLYAACIALFLGAILMIPKWWGGNDPVASGQCNHKYVALTMGLAPSCTEGTIRAYRCQYCGHTYSEQDPAPGHKFANGVCTVCGEKEEVNPAWTLEQFGDPSVIETALARMGLTLDQFSAANLHKAKNFLGNDDLHGFLMSYYYSCEEISPMELYYTFGEKCRLTADELADLGVSTDSLSMDCYRFAGEEATALLTQYAAVQPTWVDEISPVLIALGYPCLSDTFYSFVDPYYLAVKRIIVNGCGTAQSGEWIVFYETQEGDRCMVVLLPDGNGYRFVANCPTDYLHQDVPPPADCEHDMDPATCPYCACDEHVWITSENTATCTEGCRVVNTCIKCGYSHEEWQDPIPHDYASGKCTVCGKTEAVVTAGSVSLLLNEKAYQITTSKKTNYYSLSNSDAPYYFRSNHFTDPNALLEGSTVTDIRVAVLSANKGDTLTVSVVRMNGNVPGETLNTYVLTAPEKMERNCLLFGGLSIRVPVGYMLTFGAPGDTVELIYTDNTSLTYTFASTVRGEYENKCALMIDVYGVRDLDGTLNWMKKLGCPDSLLPNAVRPLNATEIDAARTFMNSDARWIITEETFFKPEDIRPYMLFYMGNGTDRLSDGEFEALKAIRGDVDVWGDCTKMTDAELDAYLMKYMGIEMEPTMTSKHLHYLDEYDTYYFFATDANFFSVSNLIGWLTEDGNYLLRSSIYMNDYTVLLKPTENSFLIQQVVWNRSSIHWD
ncbi:MAG: hypothetical protein IJW62_03915 [Clostridia bacterium]|nr:hypothetical protein [Clostridia bacterium]